MQVHRHSNLFYFPFVVIFDGAVVGSFVKGRCESFRKVCRRLSRVGGANCWVSCPGIPSGYGTAECSFRDSSKGCDGNDVGIFILFFSYKESGDCRIVFL